MWVERKINVNQLNFFLKPSFSGWLNPRIMWHKVAENLGYLLTLVVACIVAMQKKIDIFSYPVIFIRPSKTGCIVGSHVAGGRRPVLCPEHISKTILAKVMKFCACIDFINGECSAH